MPTPALVLLLLAAAPQAAPSAPADDRPALVAPPPGAEEGAPPPGTPADQALWRRLDQGAGFAAIHLARVAQCSYRIRYGRYYEGLDARAADPAAAAGARAERQALERAAAAAQEALPADGGRVRACRYTLLDLSTWMDAGDDPRAAERLPQARAAAEACAAQMEGVVAAVAPRADALEQALADVDRFLGRAPPRPPADGGEEGR